MSTKHVRKALIALGFEGPQLRRLTKDLDGLLEKSARKLVQDAWDAGLFDKIDDDKQKIDLHLKLRASMLQLDSVSDEDRLLAAMHDARGWRPRFFAWIKRLFA